METSDVIKKIENKIQFVSMLALNRTAADMAIFRYPNLAQEVFDKPTSFILRGFKYRKAEMDNLIAEVYVDDYTGPSPAKSLAAEVFGGARKPKRFELALRSAGVLPNDMFAAPGKDARIDANGNMSSAQIVQILSALSAFRETGYIANRTERSKARNRNPLNLFVINREDKSKWSGGGSQSLLGIYQRAGRGRILQLIKFVKQPHYNQRFKFFEEGERLAEQIFNNELTKAFDRYVNG